MTKVDAAQPGCAAGAVPLGLRERKKRETRAALQTAAIELVHERGLDAVTTDEIATSVGVSPRTFFNYFPTKQAAVLGLVSDDIEDAAAALAARPADEPALVSLRCTMTRLIVPDGLSDEVRRKRKAVVFGEPAMSVAVMAHTHAAENRLTEVLEARLGGEPGGSIRPRLLVSSALAAVRASMRHVAGPVPSPAFEKVLDQAFAQLAAGLH